MTGWSRSRMRGHAGAQGGPCRRRMVSPGHGTWGALRGVGWGVPMERSKSKGRCLGTMAYCRGVVVTHNCTCLSGGPVEGLRRGRWRWRWW